MPASPRTRRILSNEMLLCDFHIHTTYSDGVLPLSKVVDLFGRSGHDVIATAGSAGSRTASATA